ncbi:hypothetical protein CFREN_03565 [Corynebacterium freneyi]|nr:hypothetical protein CFREN_03565 [Corynebacterium freneyi]
MGPGRRQASSDCARPRDATYSLVRRSSNWWKVCSDRSSPHGAPAGPDVIPGSVAPRVDHPRHGPWPRDRPILPRHRRRARRDGGRRHLTAHRPRPAGDDVPAAGEGPLRQGRRNRRRQTAHDRLAAAQLGDWPRLHVRPGLDFPPRRARPAHRADHRRPRPLHRHGPRVERPVLRRPRSHRHARGHQLRLPGAHVRRARLVLPADPAVVARPGNHQRRILLPVHRHLRRRVPGHPAARRRRLPHRRRESQGPRLVRIDFHPPAFPRSRSSACCTRSSCCSPCRASRSLRSRGRSPASHCRCWPTSWACSSSPSPPRRRRE